MKDKTPPSYEKIKEVENAISEMENNGTARSRPGTVDALRRRRAVLVTAFNEQTRLFNLKADPELALEVYRHLLLETESFRENNIGAEGMYLMGALLEGGQVQWPQNEPIVDVLQGGFDRNHKLWQYISVGDNSCPGPDHQVHQEVSRDR